jgi:hypothetical protein
MNDKKNFPQRRKGAKKKSGTAAQLCFPLRLCAFAGNCLSFN